VIFYLQVDFDKSKHLSEESIKKREIETERLRNLEKNKEPIGTETPSDGTTKRLSLKNIL